jgi:hypothetical protein
MRLLFLCSFLFSCSEKSSDSGVSGDSDGGTTDGGTTDGGTTDGGSGDGGSGDGGSGDGGSEPLNDLLEEGVYYATTLSIEADTCGSMAEDYGFSACDAEITWVDASTFTIYYECADLSTTCIVGTDDSVTCDGYVQSVPLSSNVNLNIVSATDAFDVTSTTSFTQSEVITVDCLGSGCDGVAETLGTTFPCGMTLPEEFAI